MASPNRQSLVASTDEERSTRQADLQQAEADFDPLPFDPAAARSFGRVAAGLRRARRKPAARAYDAMIAAIAIANDLPLYTCNPKDFTGIIGLTVVVPHPDHQGTHPRRRTVLEVPISGHPGKCSFLRPIG